MNECIIGIGSNIDADKNIPEMLISRKNQLAISRLLQILKAASSFKISPAINITPIRSICKTGLQYFSMKCFIFLP